MWEWGQPLLPRPFLFWDTALPETRGFEEEGADGKIPTHKIQITNKSQIPMTKIQTLHSEKLLKSDFRSLTAIFTMKSGLTKSSPETRCFPSTKIPADLNISRLQRSWIWVLCRFTSLLQNQERKSKPPEIIRILPNTAG